LLRNAVLGLTGRRVDIALAAGVVALVADRIDDRELSFDGVAAEVIDLDGRTVVPGLWDCHVHVDQWSLTSHWVDLSGTTSPDQVLALVRERLAGGHPEEGFPLVGYGFRDGLWSEPPHRSQLDEVSTDVPLVMASGDLHQAWLNTAALHRYGLPADGDGIVREDAWYPVMIDIRSVPDTVVDRWVAAAASTAASRGVVGVVDFENADNLTSWPRRYAAKGSMSGGPAPVPLRVRAAVWPEYLEAAIARGLRTGDRVPGTGGAVSMGPLKVITDGSLNTRTAYCHDPYPGLEATARSNGMLRSTRSGTWRTRWSWTRSRPSARAVQWSTPSCSVAPTWRGSPSSA
jgi:predicted amidohydrolase YtcJ